MNRMWVVAQALAIVLRNEKRDWGRKFRNAALSITSSGKIAADVVVADYSNLQVGERVRIEGGAQLLCSKGKIRIGSDSQVNRGSILRCDGGDITLGRNCSLQYSSVVYGDGGVDIGDDCRISSHVLILAVNHNFDETDRPISSQGTRSEGIVIENDVWIGAGAVLLDGIRVGKGSIVGAGAVVTADVPPYTVVVGNPARFIKKRGD